jgi:hypothetical protein
MIYSTETLILKYDSLNNQIFQRSFQVPNTTGAWTYSGFYLINNQLHLPMAINLSTNESKSFILRVDQVGNMFTDGVTNFPFTSPGSLFVCNSTLKEDSLGGHSLYVSYAGSQYLGHNFIIEKYNSNSFYYEGIVFEDLDLDGNFSGSDYGVFFQPIMVLPDSQLFFSSIMGKYSVTTDSSSSKILQFQIQPGFTLTSDSSSFNIQPSISDSCCYDFGIKSNLAVDVKCDITFSPIICDETYGIWLSIRNQGNIPAVGNIKFLFDSLSGFISSSQPVSVTMNEIIWPIDTIYPASILSTFLSFTSPSYLYAGDTMNYSLSFLDTNNLLLSDKQQEVILECDYEPFYVAVSPPGIDTSHFTISTSTLEYALHFQNTGDNTAVVVRLRDTLNSNLDLSTIKIISASHEFDLVVRKGGVLECTFNNIMLPDSNIDKLKSYAYFKYSIEPKISINLPLRVENQCYVYFDTEPPIITGKSYNTLVNPLPGIESDEKSTEIKFYPNPVYDFLNIDLPLLQSQECNIHIYDILGNEISMDKSTFPVSLNISNFNNGMYVCKIMGESKTFNFKFIKNR